MQPWARVAPLVTLFAACHAAHPTCPANLTRTDDGLRLSAGVPDRDTLACAARASRSSLSSYS